jgi:hypothetical protein
MTAPERPGDVLKRATDNVAASHEAIRAESARIAQERAAAQPEIPRPRPAEE